MSLEKKFPVVQSEWCEDEDQDLHDYLSKNSKGGYRIVPESTILEMDPKSIEVLFCDTKIMQKYLDLHKKNRIYDTYPKSLQDLYNRTFETLKVRELSEKKFPYFVKPIHNDKSFHGQVVRNKDEFQSLLELVDLETEVYLTKEVHFVNEYRLFILDGKVFGMADCTDDLVDDPKDRIHKDPPSEFISRILENLQHQTCIIDCAMDKSGKWSVMEQNPPYSLASYDFPIDRYVEYCKRAWEFLLS